MSETASIRDHLERGGDAADEILRERNSERALRAEPRKGTLVAEGDSWFDYPITDVLTVLEDRLGWDVESVAHRGDNLESMAYDVPQLEGLTRTFERLHRRDDTPAGLLLSGGGNDFAGPELAMLLDHVGSGHPGINEVIADELVNRRMREAWASVIGFSTRLSERLFGAPTRTVIHGYDYAVPDGRGFLGGAGPLPGPWLAPSYARKGIDGLKKRSALTRALLDRYNVMLAELVEQPGLEHVVHVDLRGTLDEPDYKDSWANELHPTRAGFREIAGRIDRALTA